MPTWQLQITVALTALARPRRPTVILTAVLATAAGPLAWNALTNR